MTRPDLSSAAWRKSTRSGSGINCVEVAFANSHVVVRDSKARAGPTLVFTSSAWTAFMAGAKDGQFDPTD